MRGELVEAHAERGVGGAREVLEQMGERSFSLTAGAGEKRCRRACVDGGNRGSESLEAEKQHVEVAHGPQCAGERAHVIGQRVAQPGVEDRAERVEVRAELPGGDTGPVDRVDVARTDKGLGCREHVARAGDERLCEPRDRQRTLRFPAVRRDAQASSRSRAPAADICVGFA